MTEVLTYTASWEGLGFDLDSTGTCFQIFLGFRIDLTYSVSVVVSFFGLPYRILVIYIS